MNGEKPTDQQSEEKKLETAAIGKEITLKYQDGKDEVVTLREIPIYLLNKAAMDLGDEEALAARYAGRERSWVRSLTIESYELLVTEGERVNAHFFRYLRRQANRMETIRPGIMAQALAGRPPAAQKV